MTRKVSKLKSVIVEFKDPDFASALLNAGLNAKLVECLQDRAMFGEYWVLSLKFNSEGTFTGEVIDKSDA